MEKIKEPCSVFCMKYSLLWKFRYLKHAIEYAQWYRNRYGGNLWIGRENGFDAKSIVAKAKEVI